MTKHNMFGQVQLERDIEEHLEFLKQALPRCKVNQVIRPITVHQESLVLRDCFAELLAREDTQANDFDDVSDMALVCQ